MSTLIYTLVIISIIAILFFVAIWTYIRWQRIWKDNDQDWYRTAFWISLAIAVVAFAALGLAWVITN